MGNLLTYSVAKSTSGDFKLNFTTKVNTLVAYSYDSRNNINIVTLTDGTNAVTSFEQEYSLTNNKLQISFRQPGGGSGTLGGDPDIIIED